MLLFFILTVVVIVIRRNKIQVNSIIIMYILIHLKIKIYVFFELIPIID